MGGEGGAAWPTTPWLLQVAGGTKMALEKFHDLLPGMLLGSCVGLWLTSPVYRFRATADQ